MAVITIVLTGIACWDCLSDWERIGGNLVFSCGLGYGLWQANGLANVFADQRSNWLENPRARFLWGLGGMFVLSLAVIFIVNHVFFVLVNKSSDTIFTRNIIGNMIFQMIITIAISSIIHGFSFFKEWKVQSQRSLELEKEMVRAQYASLKTQVNPHFLFNNLNALSALVKLDPDKAQEFISQLGRVYRYLLDNHQEEVVPLSGEWAFAESYLYLEKIRFGDAFSYEVHFKPDEDWMLPPLALQIVLENVFKHNQIEKGKQLHILIQQNDDALSISNSIRKRTLPAESSGLGLQNLRDRYAYLTGRPVSVIQNGATFEVQLPLLKLNG